MKCSNCGIENRVGARVCKQCGKPLAREAVSSVPAPPALEQPVYHDCGAPIKPGARFCNRCGAAIKSQDSASPPSSPTQPTAPGISQPVAPNPSKEVASPQPSSYHAQASVYVPPTTTATSFPSRSEVAASGTPKSRSKFPSPLLGVGGVVCLALLFIFFKPWGLLNSAPPATPTLTSAPTAMPTPAPTRTPTRTPTPTRTLTPPLPLLLAQ